MKGWDLFRVYRTMPEDGLEIKMDASMWNFHFTYPNGIELDNELVVPKGTPVVMKMTSYDVIHSLYPVNHWVKEDAMPGRITHMWFLPTEVGESVITCAEYCGFGHSGMYGKLIVKEQADYDRWVSANSPEQSMSDSSDEHL
jgi:cytochrome c oxidase subunit 2